MQSGGKRLLPVNDAGGGGSTCTFFELKSCVFLQTLVRGTPQECAAAASHRQPLSLLPLELREQDTRTTAMRFQRRTARLQACVCAAVCHAFIITPRTFVEDLPQLLVLLIISIFNFRELKSFELGRPTLAWRGSRAAAARRAAPCDSSARVPNVKRAYGAHILATPFASSPLLFYHFHCSSISSKCARLRRA